MARCLNPQCSRKIKVVKKTADEMVVKKGIEEETEESRKMEDDMEDHGMHRVLCKVLIDHGAIVYPWPVLETSLEWVYNGQ